MANRQKKWFTYMPAVALLSELIDSDEETIVSAANRRRYHRVVVPKNEERTKFRTYMIPQGSTRTVQLSLFDNLLPRLAVSSEAYAYVPERGVPDCVNEHLNTTPFLYIDFQDAFGSVSYKMLFEALMQVMGLIIDESPKYQEWSEQFGGADSALKAKVVELVCDLVTSRRCGLPQGTVTSPYLMNVVAKALDQELVRYCSDLGIVYTRYCDDLVFSAHDAPPTEVRRRIRKIIRRHGFVINWDKYHVRRGNATEPRVMGIVLRGNNPDGQLFVTRVPGLSKAKVEEYRSFLHHALNDPDVSKAQVRGTLGWCLSVYRGHLPNRLKKPFAAYLRKHDPAWYARYRKQLST